MQQSSNSTVTANLSNGFLKGSCLSCSSPWNIDRKRKEKDLNIPCPFPPHVVLWRTNGPCFSLCLLQFLKGKLFGKLLPSCIFCIACGTSASFFSFPTSPLQGPLSQDNVPESHPRASRAVLEPCIAPSGHGCCTGRRRQLSIQLHHTCSHTALNNPFPSAISAAERGRLCIKGSVLKREEYFPRKISIQRKQSPKGTNWWTHRSTVRDLGTEWSDQKDSWEIKTKGSTCNLNFWDRV